MSNRPYVLAYNRISSPVINDLEKDFNLSYFTDLEGLDNPDFKEALEKAEGIINVELEVNEKLLSHAPNLKVVCNVSVGYDNLDIEALTKRNITATNTPGVLTDTTADAIFSILLGTARRIPELDQYVKNGEWTKVLPEEKFGTDVHHKTLGIIGMGRIGQAIAKRARFGFDMNILYYNRSQKPEAEDQYEAEFVSFDELLGRSDFVCLMTPLTNETRHLMNREAFQKMKKEGIFINGSRGETVDEKALIEALEAGEIKAAGLDVFQQEPVEKDNPLLHMENVVTTPHLGSSTHENELNMSRLAEKNLRAALQGKQPKHLINEETAPS
ncbi:2-hydroxyacid dehydrogenase [Bacillus sp. FJAT-44742]|uniref:2-hydroxyacid dehydrogenase n=1 Tax=Bacillus sp. FJAT-44742 TaxID=2014005 RepID=UPI000C2462F6|nr:D-glycerate dehydrogenase [Bacillus sp. FJAT-44742]